MKSNFNCILGSIILMFFISIGNISAQSNTPDYNPESFQENTKYIDPQIISIVIARFEDFNNDQLHELVIMSEETVQVSKAADAKKLYDKLLLWKETYLKEEEMKEMKVPTLKGNN